MSQKFGVASILNLILTFHFTTLVEAYVKGAPIDSCTTLTPIHATSAQNTTSPYSLLLKASSITPGATVALTIEGPQFRGFMAQARKHYSKDTTPYGVFHSLPEISRTIFCTYQNSTVTHVDKEIKQGITLEWTAPAEPGTYVVA